MGLFLIDKELENKYNLLIKYIKIYNKYIFDITGNFRGMIKEPDKKSKIKKKYNTFNQYLTHNKVWNNFYDLIKELNKENIDVEDYIKIMIENWENIQIRLKIKRDQIPIYNIIFSIKCIYIYNSIKNNKNRINENNKKIVVNKFINTDKYKNNLIKLNNILKNHQDLNDIDILEIFKNEFDIEFIKYYNYLKEMS